MPEPARWWRRVEGKVAIVTGAGAEGDEIGIGRAIAIALAAEGAEVSCIDLDPLRAEGTAARLGSMGCNALALSGDVSSARDCERFVRSTVERFGRLDILVNNVGISTPARLDSVDEELWDRVFDVNVKGAMLMSKFAVPHMIEAGSG